MKYFFIVILSFVFGQEPVKKTKYIVLFDQIEVLRPIPNTIEAFWSDETHFDTITISGENIIDNLEYQIEQFKALKSNSIVYQTFSIKNAIVRYAGDVAIDTIYTDKFFNFWKINEKLYQDKNQFFKKRFATISYKSM